MAKVRKFVAYRRIERPYTRISKYKKKSYIKVTPAKHIVKFDNGNIKKKFSHTLTLVSKKDTQIRDIALEAGRQTSVRALEKYAGKNDFFLRIRVFPHHILRENPLASGAGADRLSTGMAAAFGKPIGSAARIYRGQIICQVDVNRPHLEIAKGALKRFSHKLPITCTIEVAENR